MEKPDRKAQELLRQFLNTDGPKGATKEYTAGWEFNFEFTAEEQSAVHILMSTGMGFHEAFNQVKSNRKGTDAAGHVDEGTESGT